jgi:hypothetical protein
MQFMDNIHLPVQWVQKVFRPLPLFHILLQPYSKMDEDLFYLTNLHTIPHNDKVETDFLKFANVLKIKTEIPYLHKYSDPLL